MKIFFLLALLCVTTRLHAGDPATMIKQKAKDIANNNNAQQGVPPPVRPGNTPPAMPAPTPLTPEQRALVQLIADLDGSRATVLTNYADKLWDDLRAISHTTPKPTGTTYTKISNQLAAALVGKPANPQRLRLAKNLETLLNNPPPAVSPDDVIADCLTILKKSGADETAANALATELKAAVAEVRKKATAK
ncbi:MAG: hypothetical protein RL380_593 [Verrucomicrobiota bacterium]|jgi:hypothetical protein